MPLLHAATTHTVAACLLCLFAAEGCPDAITERHLHTPNNAKIGQGRWRGTHKRWLDCKAVLSLRGTGELYQTS